jgi:NTP pyrophosphatase (non-canonical NTP hydrolase)
MKQIKDIVKPISYDGKSFRDANQKVISEDLIAFALNSLQPKEETEGSFEYAKAEAEGVVDLYKKISGDDPKDLVACIAGGIQAAYLKGLWTRSTPAQESEQIRKEQQNVTEGEEWSNLIQSFIAFCNETFPDLTPLISLEKLKDEMDELANELIHGHEDLLDEYSDCLMCLISSASLAGYGENDMRLAFAKKLMKNKARTWKRNENGTYSHVKSPQPSSQVEEEDKNKLEAGDSEEELWREFLWNIGDKLSLPEIGKLKQSFTITRKSITPLNK